MSTEPTPIDPVDSEEVESLLEAVAGGAVMGDAALLESAYTDLRAIAGAFFRGQDPALTLQPTALVHEAYMKIVGRRASAWEGQSHFIAVVARAMRQVLIDHARSRHADKRGGGFDRITLAGIESLGTSHNQQSAADETLRIHEALSRLELVEQRQARVVELRFFGGMSIPQVARVLGVSDKTVELDWRFARAWLRRQLAESNP